jgi:acetolactate decarboxylase
MPRDIVDDRLIGALHLRALDRQGFRHDPAAAHIAFQAGTLHALMDGHLGGDATVGDVLAHGDLGIGTIEHVAGELIIVDGEPFVADADGLVSRVGPDTPTPFAVVCRFTPLTDTTVNDPLDLTRFRDAIDGLVPGPHSVVAVRADGAFAGLRLRSIHAQRPPYPPLSEVVAHQTEWTVGSASGTVVGFRFPDVIAGIEAPGHHLHFLSEDRTDGGHVPDMTMTSGRLAVDAGDDLHVELPDHIDLGVPGDAYRAAIRAIEED